MNQPNSEGRFCGVCGTTNPSSYNYCLNCRELLGGAVSSPSPRGPSKHGEPGWLAREWRRSSRRDRLLAVILVAALAIFAFWAVSQNSSQQPTSDNSQSNLAEVYQAVFACSPCHTFQASGSYVAYGPTAGGLYEGQFTSVSNVTSYFLSASDFTNFTETGEVSHYACDSKSTKTGEIGGAPWGCLDGVSGVQCSGQPSCQSDSSVACTKGMPQPCSSWGQWYLLWVSSSATSSTSVDMSGDLQFGGCAPPTASLSDTVVPTDGTCYVSN